VEWTYETGFKECETSF